MVKTYGKVGALKEFQKQLIFSGVLSVNIDNYEKNIEQLEEEEKNLPNLGKKLLNDELLELEKEQKNTATNLEGLKSKKQLYWEEFGLFEKIKNFPYLLNASLEISRKTGKLEMINKEIEKRKSDRILYEKRIIRLKSTEIRKKKNALQSNKNLYFGALGELKVQKVLENLSLPSVLINDFSIELENPISMKGGKDWIYSMQIDHILINQKGIFLIETKNRSKYTKENYEFSPVYQAKRHGHGFYWCFKRDIEKLIGKIPAIFNIVVLDGHKIENTEKSISILNTFQLNKFIQTRYKDCLTNYEVERIRDLLLSDN